MRLLILSILCALMIDPDVCDLVPKNTKEAKLIHYESTVTGNERTFWYNLDDEQLRSETISIVNVGPNGEQEISVRGSFSFKGSNEELYLVEYIADRNGYQPKITIIDGTRTPQIYSTGIENPYNVSGPVLKSLVG